VRIDVLTQFRNQCLLNLKTDNQSLLILDTLRIFFFILELKVYLRIVIHKVDQINLS